ncbi:6-hydroxy-D-nicotine oxidase [Beauveria bassiana]|nr:6-hydroxy-D-nicotine oxidase [Beauveria bassiana]
MLLLLATCVQWLLMAVLAEPHYVADVPAQLLPLVSEAAAVNGTDGQGCHLAVCFDPNQKPNWESQNSALTGIIFSPSANRSLRPPAWTSSCTTTTAPPSLPASRPASTPCSSASSSPLCVAEPLTAEGVAISVRAVTRHSCRFAVKSGGHSNALGTNARQSGVVIDLGRLDRIEVSGSGNGNGSSTVFIGPGNHGGRVYEELEPRGLAVAGGRVDWVGVGGFTLGGGISFLSPRHGWAVDNVRSFEVSITTLFSPLPDISYRNCSLLNMRASEGGLPVNGAGSSPQRHNHQMRASALTQISTLRCAAAEAAFGIVTRFEFEAHSLERTVLGRHRRPPRQPASQQGAAAGGRCRTSRAR